ncbi:sigma-70 family RNA polymerase sigma factor [Clostridium sp.]|uniref:sigma-70 family RNA polymerase sigma factor n=1 Tax=Clostridium sp. TaxID=1506 RepID=UPI002FC7C9DF
MSNDDLVIRAKSGDKVALEELMNKFKFYIIKCSNNVYINGYEKDDLIQIGYISLINAVKNYELTKGNFTSYVNAAIQYNFNYLIRGKAKENYVQSLNTIISENVELGDIIGSEESFEEKLMKKDTLKLVLKCVDKLPKDLKDIINYCYINNKGSFAKYSIENNIKYSTLMKKKRLALEILRALLKEIDIMD